MAPAAATTSQARPVRRSRKWPLRQAVISFAAVVAGYWLYWLIAVPLIEPGVDERSTASVSQAQIDEARADVSARQRDVAKYFSPDDWEANKPAIWRSGQMRLLYKTIEPQPDGTVALNPCTLMFFPDRSGSSQPVIMRAMQGALIRFDEKVTGLDLANRKFAGGKLPGPIRIHRQPSSPGAADDLEMTTHDIEMTPERAWTSAPVNFRLGRSYGSGRDLEILLDRSAGRSKFNMMQGASVQRVVLHRDVRLRLELNSAQPADAPAAPPAPPQPPMEITCQGRFEFQMEDYAAQFYDNVNVFRLNPTGKSDQLNCALLTVYFTRPGEKPPEDFQPQAPADNRSLASHVRLIEARGDPVTLRSPAQGMYARCKGADFVPGFGASPGSLAAFGPGVIYGNLPNDPAGKYVAQWARELRFEPDGSLERASLRGAVRVQFGLLGTVEADEIFAWLRQKPAPPQVPVAQVALHRAAAPQPADAWQIERFLARRYEQPGAQSQGEVKIDGPQIAARAEVLEATIRRDPANLPPPTAPVDRGPQAADRARPARAPPDRFTVSGQRVHIDLVPNGEELAVAGATIERGAQLEQFSTATGAPQRSLFVSGERLHVVDAHLSDTRVTITGNPGYVEAGGMALWGSVIELAKRANRLWIDGPGRLTLPIAQDLDGQPLAQPQTLAIDWKKRLDFQSNTAVFEGTVVARSEQQALATEKLEAVLTKPVDFANPRAAGGKADKMPELALVRSYGRTMLDSRQLGDDGKQLGMSRLEASDLSVDRTTGRITGVGPGWVTHVTHGRGPRLFGPEAPPDQKHAAPAAAPDKQCTYLHVTFRRGIEGNINRRAIKFFDHTKTVYGPVPDWNATLDDSRLEKLGPDGMVLEAGALEVREMNGRPNAKRGWFELDATDDVVAEGQRFTAIGTRITYSEENDLLILRGEPSRPAELYLEDAAGPRQEMRHANEVRYSISRNEVLVSGAPQLNISVPADARQKLLDRGRRKPEPPQP